MVAAVSYKRHRAAIERPMARAEADALIALIDTRGKPSRAKDGHR